VKVIVSAAALCALLDRTDPRHQIAADTWSQLADGDDAVLAHNYVLFEAAEMVRHRLGDDAVRVLVDDLVYPIEVVWIDAVIHEAAVAAMLASPHRALSLADWVTYRVARRHHVDAVFCLDKRFQSLGLISIPG
jgi:predicted nucleic acid-binding protein